jgi:DNA-binding NtrC family response regulator
MKHLVPVAVIDDDREMLRVIAKFLDKHGIHADTFSDPRTAVTAFREQHYGLIISDVQMPGMSGLEVLDNAKAALPEAIVIMITGFGSVKSAVDAMKKGAFDYISKPFDYEEFLIVVQKALAQHALQQEVIALRRNVQSRYGFSNIIGKSNPMRRVYEVIERIAHTRTSVLIEGESGTGKELIAKAIHYTGPRRDAPFVAINCGALPETLLESELFGHERGAYTGAVSRERGLFASADGGSIFLDEIVDMPLAMQAKLLRVLEDWEIRPVGGSSARRINVRVIAASKNDLLSCVERGTFREDLYYRLNVVTIHLPSLRERMEDVPLLIDHFLASYARENKREPSLIQRDALEALLRYSWPGNVRELEHVLERALIMAHGNEITLADLPPAVLRGEAQAGLRRDADATLRTLDEMEREHILHVLKSVEWRRSQAAEVLGINRRTLYRKIRDYRIEEP